MSSADLDLDVHAARAAVVKRLGGRKPTVAIVLGSGLGPLADAVKEAIRIPYAEIPGFHVPTVPGHKGELVCGTLGGKTVLCQSGRFHAYEGHSADVTALPVRMFGAVGIDTVILTNAAGGVNPRFGPGTLMLIADHINLTGRNPLVGPARPGETRFPDMTNAYDKELKALARRVALERGVALAEGVYVGLLGPTYETPAEVKFIATLGGDAVGMSTVLEVIAARARGMKCLGISTVTNAAAGISATELNHHEVMEVAARVGKDLGRLVEGIVAGI